ncbi:MAG: flavodoxin family protein [Clostridiales bacterium]|jgi:multimeric flavodoxin WrbA|nr:flavodoxin family protein [Clostridiales bacterium]
MGKNIVILSGSPRKGGNTDKLVAAFMDGAKEAGNSCTLFRVADMYIGGCVGCGHCFEVSGVCIQDDDMKPVTKALREASMLVLASPVYYFGVTAQLKLAIDRFYANMKVGLPIKSAAMLLTCGNKDDSVAEGAYAMYRHILRAYKWEDAGVITVPGLHAVDDIGGNKALQEAAALGRSIK